MDKSFILDHINKSTHWVGFKEICCNLKTSPASKKSVIHVRSISYVHHQQFSTPLSTGLYLVRTHLWSRRSRTVCWPTWPAGSPSCCSPAAPLDPYWRPHRPLSHSLQRRPQSCCLAACLDSDLFANFTLGPPWNQRFEFSSRSLVSSPPSRMAS